MKGEGKHDNEVSSENINKETETTKKEPGRNSEVEEKRTEMKNSI